MFGTYGFRPPSLEEIARKRQLLEESLAAAVPWTSDIRWQKRLVIQASTYQPIPLFNVLPTHERPNDSPPETRAVSADGRWLYMNRILPRGYALKTYNGRSQGSVIFDGPVIIPALYESWSAAKGEYGWKEDPWMSLTPMELLSLRNGTRLAKGITIVAGLGLGHQLIEVSKRRQVKRLILVEGSRSLVEFVLPAVQAQMARPLDEIHIGNAYEIVPHLAADVALIDIFPRYGTTNGRVTS